jgi:hypothetical protein
MYRLCHFDDVDAPVVSFVWSNITSSMVWFFGWLLVQARILSRASLLKKGILSADEARCPICQPPEETATHIIFDYTVARQLWARVGGRHPPDVDVRMLHSYLAPTAIAPAMSFTFILLDTSPTYP